MFVRDLELDPQIEMYPVQRVMQEQGLWHAVPLNYGKISLCRLIDFVSILNELLAQDPWAMVANRPEGV
jgi:hypothetical protein